MGGSKVRRSCEEIGWKPWRKQLLLIWPSLSYIQHWPVVPGLVSGKHTTPRPENFRLKLHETMMSGGLFPVFTCTQQRLWTEQELYNLLPTYPLPNYLLCQPAVPEPGTMFTSQCHRGDLYCRDFPSCCKTDSMANPAAETYLLPQDMNIFWKKWQISLLVLKTFCQQSTQETSIFKKNLTLTKKKTCLQ